MEKNRNFWRKENKIICKKTQRGKILIGVNAIILFLLGIFLFGFLFGCGTIDRILTTGERIIELEVRDEAEKGSERIKKTGEKTEKKLEKIEKRLEKKIKKLEKESFPRQECRTQVTLLGPKKICK